MHQTGLVQVIADLSSAGQSMTATASLGGSTILVPSPSAVTVGLGSSTPSSGVLASAVPGPSGPNPDCDLLRTCVLLQSPYPSILWHLAAPGQHLDVLVSTWISWRSVYHTFSIMSLDSPTRDSIPTTPKPFRVKRSHSEPPSLIKLDSEEPEDKKTHTGTAPEYLAALAIQRKTPESPSPTTHFQTKTLAVPADFLQDLVDARWKAERAWCNAEHRLQSQQVQKLPRT
ncbi:uncharacterized protein F5891DRAFT_983737 [Suillus fuscotomentosus]|uniref:Uncharacterized protein n=1 Tax=Suillus fuscotomentosus TaxID=1912939 RepID=A0AAD4HFS6_9AGAM|nr:uncharacterized protein F5891DRAFT_983737 [Suillus fuscotomentosus]KAG1896025.1 hypothetical protein F5891DRAFT_983737 [Suillus fuscotomentosus]